MPASCIDWLDHMYSDIFAAHDLDDPALLSALDICARQPLPPRHYRQGAWVQDCFWADDFYAKLEEFRRDDVLNNVAVRSKFYTEMTYHFYQGPVYKPEIDQPQMPQWLQLLLYTINLRQIENPVPSNPGYPNLDPAEVISRFANTIVATQTSTAPKNTMVQVGLSTITQKTHITVELPAYNIGVQTTNKKRKRTDATSRKRKETGVADDIEEKPTMVLSHKRKEKEVVDEDAANDTVSAKRTRYSLRLQKPRTQPVMASSSKIITDEEVSTHSEEMEVDMDLDELFEEDTTKALQLSKQTSRSVDNPYNGGFSKEPTRKPFIRKDKFEEGEDGESAAVQEYRRHMLAKSDPAVRWQIPRCELCIKRRKPCSRTDGTQPCDYCAKNHLKCKPEPLQTGLLKYYGRDKKLEKNPVRKGRATLS